MQLITLLSTALLAVSSVNAAYLRTSGDDAAVDYTHCSDGFPSKDQLWTNIDKIDQDYGVNIKNDKGRIDEDGLKDMILILGTEVPCPLAINFADPNLLEYVHKLFVAGYKMMGAEHPKLKQGEGYGPYDLGKSCFHDVARLIMDYYGAPGDVPYCAIKEPENSRWGDRTERMDEQTFLSLFDCGGDEKKKEYVEALWDVAYTMMPPHKRTGTIGPHCFKAAESLFDKYYPQGGEAEGEVQDQEVQDQEGQEEEGEDPCTSICAAAGAGVCVSQEDASKPECQACATCHRQQSQQDPCRAICEAAGDGVCESQEDADKPECQACVACHQGQN